MPGFHNAEKMLIFLGMSLGGAGIFFFMAPQTPWLGKLPGDIIIRRQNFTFYFPWVTGLLISILLTLIWAFFRR